MKKPRPIPSRMAIKDIPMMGWWPAENVLQVYPEVNPQVARLVMNQAEVNVKEKVQALSDKGFAPVGNDGRYFYFLKDEQSKLILTGSGLN